MLLRNVSPIGDIYLTNGYGLIEAGASFAVSRPEHVAGLIGQVENFEPDDDEARAARAAYLAAEAAEPASVEPAVTLAADVSLIKNEAT